MAKVPKFNAAELAAIREHNATMIEYCNNALLKWRQIPRSDRNNECLRQIAYWNNARAAYIWSDHMASKTKKDSQNVNRSAV